MSPFEVLKKYFEKRNELDLFATAIKIANQYKTTPSPFAVIEMRRRVEEGDLEKFDEAEAQKVFDEIQYNRIRTAHQTIFATFRLLKSVKDSIVPKLQKLQDIPTNFWSAHSWYLVQKLVESEEISVVFNESDYNKIESFYEASTTFDPLEWYSYMKLYAKLTE